MTSYTGHRQPASIVCTVTKSEHDAIVGARGRPFTQDSMTVKSAGLPDGISASLIDTYVNEMKRRTMT